MSAKTYIVHIHRHCGWHTARARGRTFGEAAKRAVRDTCKQFGLDVRKIPHRTSFKRYPTYDTVIFYEASSRSVFPSILNPTGVTTPGDLWFSQQVRQGKRGDCESCGGTNTCHYNPFVQCHACGEKNADGTQKRRDLITVGRHVVPRNTSLRVLRALERQAVASL